MKVIIAGGRDFDDLEQMEDDMWQLFGHVDYGYSQAANFDLEFLGGGAKGADALGKRWAKEEDMKYTEFPADWAQFGKQAGPLRNIQMAIAADVLVAFWDGESRGTEHMIEAAMDHNLEIHVYRYNNAPSI
jgi:hypothetical protein